MGNPTGTSGATIVELTHDGGEPIEFTTGTGLAVAKGDLLVLNDPRTVCLNDTASGGLIFAGVAAEELVAASAKDHVSAHTKGIFAMYVEAGTVAITAGVTMAMSGGNILRSAAAAETDTGAVVGKALENGETGEQIEIMVGGP